MSIVRRVVERYRRGGVAGVVESGISTVEQTLLGTYYDRYLKTRSDADPDKLLRIDPDDIEYFSGVALEIGSSGRHLEYVRRPWYHRMAERGDVIGGDWDTRTVPFSGCAEWRLLEAHIVDGVAFEETTVYPLLVERIETGGSIYGCSTVRELHDRFQYLRELVTAIDAEGYRSADEVRSKPAGVEPSEGVGVGRDLAGAPDEVTVDIGRDGGLFHYTNGRHRLAVAKLLDVPEIPVLVNVRHSDWQRKRDRVREDAGPGDREHPDLADLVDRDAADSRIQ